MQSPSIVSSLYGERYSLTLLPAVEHANELCKIVLRDRAWRCKWRVKTISTSGESPLSRAANWLCARMVIYRDQWVFLDYLPFTVPLNGWWLVRVGDGTHGNHSILIQKRIWLRYMMLGWFMGGVDFTGIYMLCSFKLSTWSVSKFLSTIGHF